MPATSTTNVRKRYEWTLTTPILACLLYLFCDLNGHGLLQALAGVFLIICVMSAVHHAEILALRVGEPYGTIILAVAVTVLEVSIIISLMMAGGEGAMSFARDTVYAAVMLILNGIVGLCLFVGARKFHEQAFSSNSVRIALVSLVSIIAFTMILPTYTRSAPGPVYTGPQLLFESVACLVIYVAFILAQTVRHREYFLVAGEGHSEHGEGPVVTNRSFIVSLVFLLVSLLIVILLAKSLSPSIETFVVGQGLPKSLVGIVLAAIILLPEGIAAVKAAKRNQLQTSINLALGSALASIGLTIPTVSLISYFYGFQLILGLDLLAIILLAISIFTVMLSLGGERSNSVYGVVLLVNLFAYIFLTINP